MSVPPTGTVAFMVTDIEDSISLCKGKNVQAALTSYGYERQLIAARSPVGEEVWEEGRAHEPRSGHLLRASSHGRVHLT